MTQITKDYSRYTRDCLIGECEALRLEAEKKIKEGIEAGIKEERDQFARVVRQVLRRNAKMVHEVTRETLPKILASVVETPTEFINTMERYYDEYSWYGGRRISTEKVIDDLIAFSETQEPPQMRTYLHEVAVTGGYSGFIPKFIAKWLGAK